PTGPETSESYNWEVSTPEEQGLDSQILADAFEEAGQRPFVRSILIVKNGYLVAEQYYRGFDRDDAHNVKSVSKSFLSALVGIALREQYLDSLGQKMLDFFPEYVTPDLDPRKYNITIRHLLMMRAGIDHERNNYSQIYSSDNWIKTTIELPLLFDPGEQFYYNTFQTHLLSAILTKATGMSTLDFANRYLLEPSHISVKDWEQGPQGYYFGGNNMFFTPRDMARFGYLYLKGGVLDGEQIVPADWVVASVTDYTGNQDWTWGELRNINYGYLWWLGEMNDYSMQLAIGYGGQFIILIPALNMIIVTTCNSNTDWDTADAQEQSVLELAANHILPAIK
ncbi:MAG: serine hydrolase domain-containing protein, partial [bacterium]